MKPTRASTRAVRWTAALVLALLAHGLGPGPVAAGDDEEGKPAPYGNTPSELMPFQGAGSVYKRLFEEPPTFRGPGRDDPEPVGLTEAAIGVLLPRSGPDKTLGVHMEQGVALALEEANAAGGLRPGMPFVAHIRDESVAWGAAANAAIELLDEHGIWGLVGALEDANTHVLTRIILKIELPVINTGGPDPTLTEHAIPWLVRMRPDDRQTSYVLARRIFQQDGRQRVAILRSNDRYGRTGTKEFVDAARRLHKPIAVEVRFESGTDDWTAQMDRLTRARPDAILLWGRAAATGRAAKALRAAGFEQPLYGPDRLVDPAFLREAGAAAEGLVFTYPFHPVRLGARWQGFVERYRKRFSEPPDAVAAYGYDGTQYLIQAMKSAGLNRVRIRERLFAPATFEGVTGTIRFDTTRNNVSEICTGHVENGAFHYDE